MADYWKEKLNPFDAELFLMVESLTEKPCEPKNGGDHYFFEADYSKHHTPEYISAVMDAIAGRLGERMIEMVDDPDRETILVRVKFSETEYPGLMQSVAKKRGNPDKGFVFCHKLEEIKAVQVKTENVQRLLEFVGNGQIEFPKDGPMKFHFLNASRSVWAHAEHLQYIVFVKEGLFEVVGKEEFELKYETKA